MRKWVVIKDNYVINAFIWDGITPYTYPDPHDLIIEDVEQSIGIGMWYEASENNFYQPIKKPNDIPQEIEYIY